MPCWRTPLHFAVLSLHGEVKQSNEHRLRPLGLVTGAMAAVSFFLRDLS